MSLDELQRRLMMATERCTAIAESLYTRGQADANSAKGDLRVARPTSGHGLDKDHPADEHQAHAAQGVRDPGRKDILGALVNVAEQETRQRNGQDAQRRTEWQAARHGPFELGEEMPQRKGKGGQDQASQPATQGLQPGLEPAPEKEFLKRGS